MESTQISGAQTFEEFKKQIQNTYKKKCPQKVRNSWGAYDYYKKYRRTRPKAKEWMLTHNQFYTLQRTVNMRLMQLLLQNFAVTLPYRLGAIEIVKMPRGVKLMEDGSVKTNRAVDWESTMQLWFEDEEAKENKTLVRFEDSSLYKVVYRKKDAIYNNKAFYEFRLNNEGKRAIKNIIANGDVGIASFYDPALDVKQFYGE